MKSAFKNLLKEVDKVCDLVTLFFKDTYMLTTLANGMGWETDIDDDGDVQAIFNLFDIQDIIDDIRDIIDDLKNKGGGSEEIVEEVYNLIVDLYEKISALSGISYNIFPFNQSAFWTQFSQEFINFIIQAYLEYHYKKVYAVLSLLDVITVEEIVPTGARRMSYKRYNVEWGTLLTFIKNPTGHIKDAFTWNTGSFDKEVFLQKIQSFFNLLGAIAYPNYAPYEISSKYYTDSVINTNNIKGTDLFLFDYKNVSKTGGVTVGINLLPVPNVPFSGPVAEGIALTPVIKGGFQQAIGIGENHTLSLSGNLAEYGGLQLLLFPNTSRLELDDPSISINGQILFSYNPKTDYVLIGSLDSSYISIPNFFASVGLQGMINDPEFLLSLGTDPAAHKPINIVIQLGEADSFITKIVGNNSDLKLAFEALVTWSSKSGFGLNFSAGFEFSIPIHKKIGPVDIEDIKINSTFGGSQLKLNFGLSFSLNLSAINVSAKEIGVSLVIDDKKNTTQKGLLGNLDFDWKFKFPSGVALSIDASAVKGGGFLNYDEATWTYTGGLELSFSKISFSAIGIVSTKLPGGKPGYSLLIIISAEFTPIQLGMGFTLTGIGGILGLNRTMNPDVLRSGIRDNTLDSILFPHDIVKNANTIISNIGQAFPAKEGQFLVGPMAKIGWGTPTLLTIELGIIIELPEPVRLAILGVVKALLPSKDNAIVKIQVNFLGIIDFTNKYLSFDASLYDSQILTFGLFGDMALRLYWGDKPNFLLSVGGFHPKFTPPPLNLPELRRLTIVLANQDNLKISVETYFAVTSNSVQFGAKVAAMAKAWKIQAIGALWFDILFQFSPFHFMADMGVMFAIKMGSKTILSLYVDLSLEGPGPWRAKGKGSFKILFVKVSVSFDKTFGQAKVEAIQAEAIDARVKAALTNRDNWEALLPDRSHQLISWREEDLSDPNAEISVDPAGALKISQRLLPLETTMAKFGSSAISDFKRYDITSVMAGTDTLPKQIVQDNFARNEFFYMTDDEKLSRPSYELFDSGVAVGSDRIDSQYAVHTQCHYEEITLDAGYRRPEPIYFLPANLFQLHRFGNYISRSGLSDFDRITTSVGPIKVKVDLQKEQFVLIDRNNMSEVSSYFSNSVDAQQFLSAQLAGAPATAANWIVANRFEL